MGSAALAAVLAGSLLAAKGLPAELGPALDALGGADLVVFEGGSRVMAATRVRAPVGAVRRVLLDTAGYPGVIPAVVRAETVGRRRSSERAPEERLVAWELEIPLFNLEGKMWVKETATGSDAGVPSIEVELVEGHMAPGRFRFTLVPGADGSTSILAAEGHVNLRATTFFLRRLAARSHTASSGLSAAAALVLIRATAERAERPDAKSPPRPHGEMKPPATAALDGAALASPPLSPFRARGVAAAVRRGPAGRLVSAHVAFGSALEASTLKSTLAEPQTWKAFPGWRKVTAAGGPKLVDVDADMPLCDLDARWAVADGSEGPRVRATAVRGATRGAVLGWDALPAGAGSLAVLSLHPRLDAAGFFPRRFIAAEPLLEHGLTLALTYANAMGVKQKLGR